MYKRILIIVVILIIVGIYAGTSIINKNIPENHIILTRIPANHTGNQINFDEVVPGYDHAQLVIIDPDRPESSQKILTEDLFSACSPELSYDNKKLVYSGKKTEKDPWQIWVTALPDSKPVQITNEKNDCFDPVFLPDGRIVFSMAWNNEKFGNGNALYTCHPDGSNVKPITFHPHSDHSNTILHDGRILTVSQQVYPEPAHSKLMALRPDGTKAELFHKIPQRYKLKSQARETTDKNIVYVASYHDTTQQDQLIQVNYNNPFDGPQTLFKAGRDMLHSVYPKRNGNMIVSYRIKHAKSFGLYEYNTEKGELGKSILQYHDYHLIDPLVIEKKQFKPKELPTTVDESQKTGFLVCLNAAQSRISMTESKGTTQTIQVLGIDGILGEIPVAQDGSFYLKLGAKTPIRFQSVNEQNEVLRGPSSWMWLMPNERRGCTGCHEKKSIAPQNKVPQAIESSPVEITGLAPPSFIRYVRKNVANEVRYEDK